MAIVQNPLIGRSKQKVGGTVFSTWKGINVLRAKPIEVANPKTPGQLLQRAKLRNTVLLYRNIPGMVQIGYRQQAVQMSEYNAFASDTLLNAFSGTTAETVAFEPASLKIAKGTMQQTAFSEGSPNEDNDVLEWNESSPLGPGQSSTDLAYGLAIGFSADGDFEQVQVSAAPVARTVGEIEIVDSRVSPSNTTQLYLFFASVVNQGVSDSLNVAHS